MIDLSGNSLRPAPRYWAPWLWASSIVLTGVGGYLLGGVETQPKLLAAVRETLGDMFGVREGGFDEAIDLDTFAKRERVEKPIRVIRNKSLVVSKSLASRAQSNGGSAPETEVAAVLEHEQCRYDADGESALGDVIINEVAWMGGLASEGLTANDEWFELFNRSDTPVAVGGWQLVDSDEQILVTLMPGIEILPGQYLLFERTDDGSVPGVTADTLYSGNLANEDEGLQLFNEDCLLVDAIAGDSTWPAGDAENRRTMERSADLGWHTYSGPLSNAILGTPRAANSEAVYEPVETVEKTEEKKTVKKTSSNSSPAVLFTPCPRDDSATATHAVLLNEIAWAGGAADPNEEWLELKNTTSSALSLGGWQLEDEAGEIQVVLAGEVEEFFLLRRILTDDDPETDYTVGLVTADQTYTGVLQNSDEALYLFNEACVLVDRVTAVGANWQNIGGSASPEYRTAERVTNELWQTYLGDGEGGLMGTPKISNSVLVPPEEEEEEETPPAEEPDDGEEDVPPEEAVVELAIVEIVFDPEGSDAGQERVVIENSGTDLLLENYSLQYLKAGGEFTDVAKKNFETGHTIAGGGTFTVGMSCSGATPCEGTDMSWSQALGNDGGTLYIVANQEKITDAADLDIVTESSYEPIPDEPPV